MKTWQKIARIVRVPLAFVLVAWLLGKVVLKHRAPLGIASATGFSGLILVVAGVLIRAWAAGIIRKGGRVTKEGPYALVRHPLYLGSLLIAVGFCVVIGDPWNIAALLLYAVVIYVPKIRAEEREMAEKFGSEYSEYASAVPAFLPMKLPRTIAAEWSFAQFRHHREYRAAIAAAAALILLELLARRAF